MSESRFSLSGIVLCAAFTGCLSSFHDVHAQDPPPTVALPELRFEDAVTAVINARHWDATQPQWTGKTDTENPRFFDAAHRFLLVRFPGCAQILSDRLGHGQAITSAKLLLTWEKQEWLRVAGYSHRGYKLKGKPVDAWHARVWAVRKPWDADPELGPTWNADINGACYWRAGGALALGYDRSGTPLGQALLAEEHPSDTVDVTAILTSTAYGQPLGERLRNLEDRGFLLDKAELCGPHHGEWGLSTGNARLWIKPPTLV